jgi:hypothetical protein
VKGFGPNFTKVLRESIEHLNSKNQGSLKGIFGFRAKIPKSEGVRGFDRKFAKIEKSLRKSSYLIF